MRLGTLPSKNSFRPAIPKLPTTRTSTASCSGGAHDRQRRIGIDHDERMTALPSELLRVCGELITGCRCTRALGRSELRGSGVLRHDYLDHEEFRNVPFGKQCSPLDGLF